MEPGYAGNLPVARLLEEAINLNTDPKVAEKLKECQAKDASLNTYLKSTCTPGSPLLQKIIADTLAEPWDQHYANGLTSGPLRPFGMSGNYEAQFLKAIAELSRAERILEIGMYTGCSAVAFAESSYSKEVVSLEYEQFLESFVMSRTRNTIVEKKHRILIGAALDSLEKLKAEGKPFDLVFIDADKENYPNYYSAIMDNNLLSSGGIILVDNALYFGSVYPTPTSNGGLAINKLNEMIRTDERVEQVLVPMRDGVFIVRSKQK